MGRALHPTIRTVMAPPARPPRAATVIVVIGALALLLRLFVFVRRFSIDLVYWDQWGFLEPFFRQASLLEAFRWQHGPHRQGVAALIYAFLLPATSWSGQAEALLALALVACSCSIALLIKRAVAGPILLFDIFIPLACFGLSSYELFVGAQNLANGPLPLFLCMSLAAALRLPCLKQRVFALALGAALSVYTGFALFLAPLTAVLLLLELRGASRPTDRNSVLLALGLVLGSSASFFVGYIWLPAVPCFDFPHFPVRDYVVFLSGMTGRAWGVFSPNPARFLVLRSVLSVLLFVATAGAAAWGLVTAWRAREPSDAARRRAGATVFLLCGFSVLFILFTTLGRTCLGAPASLPSRYTIYSVPGMCGLFIGLRSLRPSPFAKRFVTVLPVLLTCILVAKERRSSLDWDYGGWMAVKKAEWVQCHLSTADLAGCDSSVGFPVFPPEDRGRAHIEEKLLFLRTHRLSLFAGPPPRFEGGRRIR